MRAVLFLTFLMFASPALNAAVMVGWEADLQTFFHGVKGKVTIQDDNTLAFENFTYDGTGPAVYFYLTGDLGAVESGFILGDLPTGTSYNEEDFTLDLEVGKSLSDFSAISVWCRDFDVDFGSGEFMEPVPEPSTGLLLALLGVAGLLHRRRMLHCASGV